MENKRLAKLFLEKTALKNCRIDMSDVRFELGKSLYSTKIFALIALYAVIFGGRIFARMRIGNPDMQMSVTDILFLIIIGLLLIYTIVSTAIQSRRASISVYGKELFYNGDCWKSDDITCVKCSKFLEIVEVYSNGKKILSFPWELDNSELFIAWVKKCGIKFEDNRV
jgi:hypothetical protein